MTRAEFMQHLGGAAAAVKTVAQTEADGTAPRQRRLLAIEFPSRMSQDAIAHIKDLLRPYEKRYSVDFIVIHDGGRIVDPRTLSE